MRAISPLVCFSLTVPFALVLNSARVTVTTQLYCDGTGLRQVSAEADSYFSKSLDKWVRDVEAGAKWQEGWREESKTKSTTTVTWNFIANHMQEIGQSGTPQIADVFQDPLSIYTTYTWSERVSLKYRYDTNQAEAKAGGHCLIYHVAMPGTITEAVSTPVTKGGGHTTGRQVVFVLDASVPEYNVVVTARAVRWGYLVLVAYLALFIAYHLASFVVRRLRSRPKRI